MTCLALLFDTMSGVIKLQHFMPAITNTTLACNPSVDKLLSNNNVYFFFVLAQLYTIITLLKALHMVTWLQFASKALSGGTCMNKNKSTFSWKRVCPSAIGTDPKGFLFNRNWFNCKYFIILCCITHLLMDCTVKFIFFPKKLVMLADPKFYVSIAFGLRLRHYVFV